jgi:hypothetical protein
MCTPEHRTVVRVGDDLHEATLTDDVGLADRPEVKLLDDDLAAGLACLRFGQPNACELGRAVRHAGDAVIVDRRDVDAGDPFGDRHPLGERDVRELQRRRGDVADRPDAPGRWCGAARRPGT